MLYGLVLQLLFLGLGLHYVLRASAAARSKTIVGGLLAAVLLFGRWMPSLFSLSIQLLMSGYIVMYYRLQELSPDGAGAQSRRAIRSTAYDPARQITDARAFPLHQDPNAEDSAGKVDA